jgi:hypothetical protein|tara:strand:- start:768 stop:1007 length:240 start_codon:yes stop_codon:yes gene_type:complete
MKNNRLLNGEKVTRIQIYDYHSTPKIRGFSGGLINDEIILDKNGKPLHYNKIGEPEGTITSKTKYDVKIDLNDNLNEII